MVILMLNFFEKELIKRILMKVIRISGILFGFILIIVYIYEFKNGTLRLIYLLRDITTVLFGTIIIVPFYVFKRISMTFNYIIFAFLAGFATYFIGYFIVDIEWFTFTEEKLFTTVLILLEILIVLSNLYAFYYLVIKKDNVNTTEAELSDDFYEYLE